MGTQTIIVRADNHQETDPQTIVLGRRGSYGVKRILFDCREVMKTFPDISGVDLWIQLSGAVRHFTLPLNGSIAVWDITEADTFLTGAGEIQLFCRTVSGGIWKSNIYPAKVLVDIENA